MPIGRLPNGEWGPIPDLEVRRVTDEEGRDSYLYCRIPLSRQDDLSKASVVTPTAALDALTSLLAEPKLVKEGLPRVEATLGARWLSL